MARKKDPLAIQILKGKKPAGDVIDFPSSIPSPPITITTKARPIYAATAQLLSDIGTITKVDGAALTRYAEASVVLRAAYAKLALEGHYATRASDGSIIPHPALRIISTLTPMLVTFESDFGLNAAARMSLRTAPPSTADTSKPDTFATKFLG